MTTATDLTIGPFALDQEKVLLESANEKTIPGYAKQRQFSKRYGEIKQNLNNYVLCLKKHPEEDKNMIKILVVEDDVKLNRAICAYLGASQYEVVGCHDANEAYNEMYNNLFDLIISDIMMPGIDGFEFAKTVRDLNRTIPILFVSAKDDIQSKHRGFNLGIDDYMVKPIDFEELILRVQALLRRANLETDRKIVMEHLVVDLDAMEILVDNQEVAVTTREFNILYKMLSYPNKTFSRAQLMDEFWGYDSDTSLRAVDVVVTKLRDKFSGCNDFEIRTIRGLGYKVVVR